MSKLLEYLAQQNNQPEREEYVTAPEPQEKVDWNKIAEFEGGNVNKAYVPQAGKSGVTIGEGLDLGQRSHLDDLDLSPELKQRYAPFLGLKREDAEKKLAEVGNLQVSPEEAQQTSLAARQDTLNKLKRQWEQSSDTPFDDLSPAQQTVLASVMHQYGNLNRTPSFKSKAVSGEWDKVLEELRNFKDKYPSRRNKEADILERELSKNKYAKM